MPLLNVVRVFKDGLRKGERQFLNFIGATVTVTDRPREGRIDIEITPGDSCPTSFSDDAADYFATFLDGDEITPGAVCKGSAAGNVPSVNTWDVGLTDLVGYYPWPKLRNNIITGGIGGKIQPATIEEFNMASNAVVERVIQDGVVSPRKLKSSPEHFFANAGAGILAADTSLAAALADAAAGTGECHLGGLDKVYKVNLPVEIPAGVHLYMHGAKIKAGSSIGFAGDGVVKLSGASSGVSGGIIDGTGDLLGRADYGINVDGATRPLIRDVLVQNAEAVMLVDGGASKGIVDHLRGTHGTVAGNEEGVVVNDADEFVWLDLETTAAAGTGDDLVFGPDARRHYIYGLRAANVHANTPTDPAYKNFVVGCDDAAITWTVDAGADLEHFEWVSGGSGGPETDPLSVHTGDAAGGDLGGTYPNPNVAGLLSNALPALAPGFLEWDGAAWQFTSSVTDTGAIHTGDAAGGDLTGTYPNPTIATGAVTSAKIADGTITDTDVAAANKDGLAAVASMRTLGTTGVQAAAGNDSRLSDSRAPTGSASGDLSGTYPAPTVAGLLSNALPVLASGYLRWNGSAWVFSTPSTTDPLAIHSGDAAGGDLTGTYPNPTIATAAVTSAKIADGTITDTDVNAANKDGLASVASMRTLGTTGVQAAAGNDSRLSDSRAPSGSAGGDLTGTYPNPTIDANKVTDAKLRQSAARSVVGTAGNATANVADISAVNASDAVLRESGGSIAFGTVATAGIANAAVTGAKIASSVALAGSPTTTTQATSDSSTKIATTDFVHNVVSGAITGGVMAFTASSGTQTSVVTTEHTLFDSSTAGLYQFFVELTNMVAGDVVEIRVYQMLLTGGTRKEVFFERYAGAQSTDDLIELTDLIANELTDSGALRLTLKQTFGTAHNYNWKVVKVT